MFGFNIEPAKRNGGFVLWGSDADFRALHSFVMGVSEHSSVLDAEGLTIALAYDLRKAYEGQREIDRKQIGNDTLTLYGVEQVWPTFITQVALLRTGLGYCPSSKEQQGNMYLLEHFMDQAVRATFPAQAEDILDSAQRLVGTAESGIAPLLGSRVSYFLSSTATKRRNELYLLLSSLHPYYKRHHDIWVTRGVKGLIDPKEFETRSWDDLDTMSAKDLTL